MEADEYEVVVKIHRFKDALGKAIQEERIKKRLRYIDFSERSNISVGHLQNIVGGAINPTLESLVRIALALEIPLSELFASAEELMKGVEENEKCCKM